MGRQTSMVLELERDLQDTKKQLHRLREQRDHFRSNSEINFLKRMLDEEERSLEEVLRVSCIMDQSWKDVQAGTEAIEGQRKLIQRQVVAEEELLRQAKRQNAEMTTRIERFRRQQVALPQNRTKNMNVKDGFVISKPAQLPMQLPRQAGR